MQSIDTITQAEWLNTPETRAVMTALDGFSEAQPSRFVGGCVRNQFLGFPVHDIDIATVFVPDEVVKKLESADIKAIPTGIDHGTVTAVINKKSFEITTLRKDVETDGRHAVVSFTDDWVEDAKRRDFTMNTLLMSANGALYDPLGSGVDDARSGCIIFVGDAVQRIREDYLRILRFFRFHAIYGQGDLDPVALKACRAEKEHIQDLSRERVTAEFFKLLAADDPVPTLNVMYGVDILQVIAPNAKNFNVLDRFIKLQTELGRGNLAARLFLMSGDLQNIIIPKALRSDIDVFSSCDMKDGMHHPRRQAYWYGEDLAVQCALLYLARDEGRDIEACIAQARQYMAKIQKAPILQFPINGQDLIKRGLQPGADMGKALKQAEKWWVEQDFQPDAQAVLHYIDDVYGSR